MSFTGKTLQGKRKTRGVDDPQEQADSFLEIYPQFHENFSSLPGDTQESFTDNCNNLLEDRNVGSTLGTGEVDAVKEEFNELEKPDLKTVMNFLIAEQVIEFDD